MCDVFKRYVQLKRAHLPHHTVRSIRNIMSVASTAACIAAGDITTASRPAHDNPGAHSARERGDDVGEGERGGRPQTAATYTKAGGAEVDEPWL